MSNLSNNANDEAMILQNIFEDDSPNLVPLGTGDEDFDKAVTLAGYSYDPEQDIFYSNMYPWQRKAGYCRLYDEAAAPLGMIVDSEPIYFEYDQKKWMIEFWKGQFDYVTGGEIGVYTRPIDLSIPGVFSGSLYHSADDSELLNMSFSMIKNGKTLFKRKGEHWWLTGFKLGEFSEPSELKMDIKITFEDIMMRDAFLAGLINAGYSDQEYEQKGESIKLRYDIPHTPQPKTRMPDTDWIIQRKNEEICKKYLEITRPYKKMKDKVKALKQKFPKIYDAIIDIGKTKQQYEIFELIEKYLIQ